MPRFNQYLLAVMFLFLGTMASAIQAQDEVLEFDPFKPLYQQQPFDLLTDKNGKEHRIVPLDLPVRKVTPQPGGMLTVQLLSKPEEPLQIKWSNIEKVELFEDMVLAEAVRLSENKEFDEAFRHFVLLTDRYPQTQGLDRAVQNFLFLNAGFLATNGRIAESMSALEELFQRNPDYVGRGDRSVSSALSQVAGLQLQQYIDAAEYGSARQLLKRLEKQYGESRLPSVVTARNSLAEKASAKADEVRQLVTLGQLLEAQIASREMLRIWPELEGGLELAREVARKYPIVTVGVLQRAQTFDPASLNNWSARRTGRLLGRQLVEYVKPGLEGGVYTTPYGSVQHGDDFLSLSFDVNAIPNGPSDQATAYDIADRLLKMGDPGHPMYTPGWADILGSIRVNGAQHVDVRLRRSHMVPEAFLRVPLLPGDEQPAWVNTLQHYELTEQNESQLRFLRKSAAAAVGPAEIRERYFEDAESAIEALQKGEILVIDRLFPGDAAKLMRNTADEVEVRPYGAPTLHLLIPNTDNPYLNSLTFRRALVYAIPRQRMLEQMLQNSILPGCRVITGPIPPGSSSTDPIGYAYDDSLREQPFDPGAATLLFAMTRQQLKKTEEKKQEAERQKLAAAAAESGDASAESAEGQPADGAAGDQPPPVPDVQIPELKKLVIAHPEDATAKYACTVIAAQLQLMNITCELKQLPAGQVDDPERKYDLLYASVTVEEPLVDVQWLLSSQGIGRANSPYINLGLRRVQEASTWREVRDRLKQLHQITYSEMPIIPLWQIQEHYAQHRSIQGLKDQIGTLYQDVERWQIEPVVQPE